LIEETKIATKELVKMNGTYKSGQNMLNKDEEEEHARPPCSKEEDKCKLSRGFRERFRELLRLARSGISEFLAGAPEFRCGTPL
jgi:hypothetical protein